MASFPPNHAPQQATEPPHAAQNAHPAPTAPTKDILKPLPLLPATCLAQAQCPRPPLRRLAPKPPPPTPGISRRDSLINDSDNFIPCNPCPTSGPTTSSLGPLKHRVHVRSRSKPSRSTTHHTNTNANPKLPTTSIRLEEPTILPPPAQKTAEPVPAHKQAEKGTEDCEERDHRNGLHEGRDPYGLASKPYIDIGECVPWGRCGECQGGKRGGSMMEGGI